MVSGETRPGLRGTRLGRAGGAGGAGLGLTLEEA